MDIIDCIKTKTTSKDLQGYYIVTTKAPIQAIIARFKTLSQAEQFVQNNK